MGKDLVDGLTLLQAGGGPPPGTGTARAMEQFDEAYAELAQQRVIGN
ncbi:hypothetical protein AB0I60_01760 [Actinosynnema sp. NPDC050436]